MVRLEALETILTVMPHKVSVEQIDKDILPIFVRHI
jgi:hypothetical protein